MPDKIEKKLKDWLDGAKRVVIAGIGNPIRQDDYIGLKIVEDLKNKLSKNVLLLECETVPESYLLDIEEFNPTNVLLVDAAFLGLKPGQVRLVDAESIVDFSAVTTHILPLRLFCEYVKQATGAKIGLLLVEPKNMEFGEGLSSEVQATAKKLTEVLLGLFG
ncbi:MAG: hydrogenase 3 maturation endopeptidase HyCI [Candidatus Bathyarchaeota archaeon]|nr:hydrogenase 3 maturation endopeptidase HyCI [Candidatus Bathyarchaeota archaeon]